MQKEDKIENIEKEKRSKNMKKNAKRNQKFKYFELKKSVDCVKNENDNKLYVYSKDKTDRTGRLFSDTIENSNKLEKVKERASSAENKPVLKSKEKNKNLIYEKKGIQKESGILESLIVAGSLYFLRKNVFKNNSISLTDWKEINWNSFSDFEIEKILKSSVGIAQRYKERQRKNKKDEN